MDTVPGHGPSVRAVPGAAPGPGDAAAARAKAEVSFLDPFERMFASAKRLGSNYATLAVLDVRRAAVQFAWLVAGGIFISVLAVTAWLAAVIALAVWLLGSGMSWPAVLLIAGALNLVGAGMVVMRLKNVFEQVPFSATLHQMNADASTPAHGKHPGTN